MKVLKEQIASNFNLQFFVILAAVLIVGAGTCICADRVLGFNPNAAIITGFAADVLLIWIIYEVYRSKAGNHRSARHHHEPSDHETKTYVGNYFCCSGCGKNFKVDEEILVDKNLNVIFCSSKESRRRCMRAYLERSDLETDIKAVPMKFHGNT